MSTTTRPRRLCWHRGTGKPPAGAVIVTRLTRWGNPFEVIRPGKGADPAWKVLWGGPGPGPAWDWPIRHASREDAHAAAVAAFRRWIAEPRQAELLAAGRRELAGKDLACACPVGAGPPCHGDTWLALVNR